MSRKTSAARQCEERKYAVSTFISAVAMETTAKDRKINKIVGC